MRRLAFEKCIQVLTNRPRDFNVRRNARNHECHRAWQLPAGAGAAGVPVRRLAVLAMGQLLALLGQRAVLRTM